MLNRRHARQRAQAIVWVVAMVPFFVGIAGLSIDAGRLFDAQREAQNVADGAARVAAMQLDTSALHSTGKLQLSSTAQGVALRYMRDQEQGAGWAPPDPKDVQADGTGVTVTVRRQVTTTIVRIVNAGGAVTVSATARAEPCFGVVTGRRVGGGQC